MVISAAIKYPDGEIVSGLNRHYKIIALQAKLGTASRADAIQGFVNHRDEFLTREEAKREAIAEGQLDPKHEGELYSEDLWSDRCLECEACD